MPYCVKNELHWEDFKEGDFVGETLFYIIPEDIVEFCKIYGIKQPHSLDPSFAARSEFKGIISPPQGQNMFGHFFFCLRYGAQKLTYDITMHSFGRYEWYREVHVGDLINAKMYVDEKFQRRDKRYLTWRIECFNQRGEPVSTKWHRSNWPELPADEMIALGAVERGVASKEFEELARELMKKPYYEDKAYGRWLKEKERKNPEDNKATEVSVYQRMSEPIPLSPTTIVSVESDRWHKPLKWEEIKVGDEVTPLYYRESYERMYRMCMYYGDFFSWHITEVVAKKSPFRSKQVSQGLNVECFPIETVVQWCGTPSPIIYGGSYSSWLFHPIYGGDLIMCQGRLKDKKLEDGKKVIYLDVWSTNQDGFEVQRGEMKLCFK